MLHYCCLALLSTRQRREEDRRWAALPCRLRLASSPPNVVLSFFPCIPRSSSSIVFFARPLPPSDPIQVTLGPQWAHPRPPTATPHTRGLPPPTTVPRSTPSSPIQTHTLPPNLHPRVCSKREARMSTPRCWPARGRQQPWHSKKPRATTSETSTMRTITASRRAHGT